MTLVGLLGDGIAHSLTPPMHRREAERLGLDYEYRVIDIADRGEGVGDLPAIMLEVAAEGYDALNVTHPFKQRVIPYLDELSDAVARLEAVNLILFRDGRAIGHNTDWTGFRWAVETGLGDVRGERVVQVGAGGAGAATAYALLDLGVRGLVVGDVDDSRAAALAARYRSIFGDDSIESIRAAEVPAHLGRADGVVHATPVGMLHNPGTPFDVEAMAADAWLADVVYLPLRTELLRGAEQRGHRVLDGGRMAVGQAADSVRLITGLQPDTDRMREHFLELVAGVPADRGEA